ncbi:3'-5' exonuclease [Paludibacterium paludis]|uniref:3'-5' exonuclease n=1 Tax=Paludibacterium paludis TaxID=1225769 RepID=A0A918P539_9NEIS|nr:3'-5' exonuclease [Paludibacterium paludis]GGY24156.1 3'-5' exonuclease [Paludibacterium paludis]
MIHDLVRRIKRRRLKDNRFASLFEPSDGEWVALDCETTSLDVREAELLSIGAVRIRGNRILAGSALNLVVRPRRMPDAGTIRVHGLRKRDVTDGLPPEEAVSRLLEFIGGRDLVGYYLEYDVAVLNKTVKPLAGITLPNRQIEVSGCYYDYRLRQHPDSFIDLRLEALQSALGIPVLPRHDALNDAITAAMLFLALKKRGAAQ